MDVQLLLNGMLPPSERFKSAIEENDKINKLDEISFTLQYIV